MVNESKDNHSTVIDSNTLIYNGLIGLRKAF